ncbi:hypothetical protein F5Y16DRAFT_316305 [Xylariaceae sp. FL0255]|nr:hypothetical protein F5Y16DRAFT_316305 [Xylariaceae sp. FL0255]
MSSANDNAMTRFLFAILQQKNLKDIDWNKVAHDPILAQEITNGHAARMRYSRFKTAMLGLEPTRRNRTGPARSRVTKAKKDPKNRKEGAANIKAEAAAESPSADSPEPPEPSPRKIKQETNMQFAYNNRMTPALTPGPPSAPSTSLTSVPMLQPRFLTPCSDTDMYSPSPALASSPANDMVHSQSSFDFHGPSYTEHAESAWPHTTTHFANAFSFDDYTAAACDHQHLYHTHRAQHHLPLPSQSVEGDMDQVDVKHEDWEFQH